MPHKSTRLLLQCTKHIRRHKNGRRILSRLSEGCWKSFSWAPTKQVKITQHIWYISNVAEKHAVKKKTAHCHWWKGTVVAQFFKWSTARFILLFNLSSFVPPPTLSSTPPILCSFFFFFFLGAEMLSCEFADSLCGWSQPSVHHGYSWVYARASPHTRRTGPITGYSAFSLSSCLRGRKWTPLTHLVQLHSSSFVFFFFLFYVGVRLRLIRGHYLACGAALEKYVEVRTK